MDSRKSTSDLHGPFSYLEDVPFKIGDKFRIPDKVGLPIGFCVPDVDQLLREAHYDFLLEKKTIHWAEEIKQIKDAQKDAELKAKAVHCQSDLEAISGSECDKSVNVAPSINPFLATLQHNNILTPTPANSSIGKVTSPPHLKADFNPADFECEEDPFDKLELKTIDDKEELKSILNVHVKPVSHPDSPPDDKEQSVDSSAKELDISTPSKPEDLDIKLPPKPNGLINLPQLQNCELIPTSSTVSLAPITSVSNIKSLSFPKLDSDEGDQTMSQLPSTFHSTTCLSNGTFLDTLKNNSPRNSSELNGHHSLGPSLLHLDPLVLPVIPPFTATQIPTSGTEEISRISPNNGSRTPAHQVAVSKLPNNMSCTKHVSAPAYQDLLEALSVSERQCVETIVGMGYSYQHVMCAMHKQGQNIEQVLEYLFVHSQLCEKGFDSTLVEDAMEMYQCSEEKTMEFLQLMCKFKEMGFEQKDIKEVLLLHNNDQDKALEDLMARAGAS